MKTHHLKIHFLGKPWLSHIYVLFLIEFVELLHFLLGAHCVTVSLV